MQVSVNGQPLATTLEERTTLLEAHRKVGLYGNLQGTSERLLAVDYFLKLPTVLVSLGRVNIQFQFPETLRTFFTFDVQFSFDTFFNH